MKIKLEPELAFALYHGEEDDCYEWVMTEYYGEWRWGNNHRMIIRDVATGKYFAAICQEQIGDHYYNSFDPEVVSSPIEFTEVIPKSFTITQYVEVEDV